MPQPMFYIEGKVIDKITYGLQFAPEKITTAVRKRLFIERNQFVGKKRGHVLGSFTRRVMNMNRRSRPGKLPINVAGMFRGFMKVPSQKTVDGMVLRMGILPENPKPFVKGIMQLQHGFTRTSGKFMPLPVYENLARAGITGGFYRAFRTMTSNDEIVTIRTGGQVLFVSKEMIESGSDVHSATLFIGTKRVQVRPMNFKFVEQWRTRWPGVQKRLQNAVNREIRSIEKGYVKAV